MGVYLLLGVFLERLLANVDHLVLSQTKGLGDAGAGFKGRIGALGSLLVVPKEEDCIPYIIGHLHFND